MRIAFDAKRAFLNKSGLGNYSRSLITSMIQNFPENSYTLFTTKKSELAFADFISQRENVNCIEPKKFIDKKISSRWRSFKITTLLNQNAIDVYHGLSNELPLNIQKFKGKKIVTIHDLIFLRYPELYPLIDRTIYNKKFRKACEMADFIVATSEQTKRDILEFYKIPEQKVRVVYQSCATIFYQEQSEEKLKVVKAKYNLPDNYLLSVGTIEERKNLLTIVKALNLLRDIKLVVVGKKRDYFKTVNDFIVANKLESRVLFLEKVETEELPAIYKLAQVFIYPSLFEGFGIPVIEALTSKTAVIAANTSSLPEAGGTDSIYFDATNHEQLAIEIQKIISSLELQNIIIEKGYSYSQKFRPEVIANEMMKIYLE